MHRLLAPALALSLLAPASALADDVQWAQLTIHERIIIRMPRPAPPGRGKPLPVATQWDEKHAGKCVAVTSLTGAAIARPDSVDLTLNTGGRLRAALDDDCPAIDFYSGFYLRPTPDGKICAGRDAIYARSGGACAIERFRKLVPKPVSGR